MCGAKGDTLKFGEENSVYIGGNWEKTESQLSVKKLQELPKMPS